MDICKSKQWPKGGGVNWRRADLSREQEWAWPKSSPALHNYMRVQMAVVWLGRNGKQLWPKQSPHASVGPNRGESAFAWEG